MLLDVLVVETNFNTLPVILLSGIGLIVTFDCCDMVTPCEMSAVGRFASRRDGCTMFDPPGSIAFVFTRG